jgi:predicted lysophospholipase L1 biosynthesis ABC-type transport system permease subunit
MALWSLAIIVGNSPPQLVIPALAKASLGWLLGIMVFIGPIVFMLASYQRRIGQWWALIAQWRTLAFWMLLIGSLVASFGIFALVGIIPTWQGEWSDWHIRMVEQNTSESLRQLISWNALYQKQFAFMLQFGAASLFLVGAACIALSQTRLTRRMRRIARRGPDDWLLENPETGSYKAPRKGKVLLDHPYSGPGRS